MVIITWRFDCCGQKMASMVLTSKVRHFTLLGLSRCYLPLPLPASRLYTGLPLPAWSLHAVIADNKAIGPDETVELSRDLKIERLAAPSTGWYHQVRALRDKAVTSAKNDVVTIPESVSWSHC